MRPSARALALCLAALAGCYKGGDEPGVLTATSTSTSTADDGSATAAPLPFLDLAKQCTAWTTSSKDAAGRWGTLSSTDKNWSNSIDAECSATARLLCIEQ